MFRGGFRRKRGPVRGGATAKAVTGEVAGKVVADGLWALGFLGARPLSTLEHLGSEGAWPLPTLEHLGSGARGLLGPWARVPVRVDTSGDQRGGSWTEV